MLIVDTKGNHKQMQFRLEYQHNYAIIVQVQIVFFFEQKKSQSAPRGTKQLNFC